MLRSLFGVRWGGDGDRIRLCSLRLVPGGVDGRRRRIISYPIKSETLGSLNDPTKILQHLLTCRFRNVV